MRDYNVLIVDDDSVDRELYCRLLSQAGSGTFHLQQARNGAEGLSALQTAKPDCILLDFTLPDMTGLQFLNAASVDGELPCAMVLITGHGNEAIAVEAMKRGVQDYLVKDQVNGNSLWRSVTHAVSQVELRQRLAGSMRELTATNLALEQEIATRKASESELRIAKETAEQANQAKTRFVSMVTHELRTPLNGILGYAQLLRIEGSLTTRQDAQLAAMMQAGRHLLDMIERVLDFADIEIGRLELHPAKIQVHDLIEACISFISPIATRRGLSLRVVNMHDAPRQVIADPTRLRQVVLNLLGNAVKYTDSGSVELRTLRGAASGTLRIEVADTGRGVDAANRPLLFKDFERLDAASSVEGAGLGLAIAERIVSLMGGTIDYMDNPTGGSVFWLELPSPATEADDPLSPQDEPAKNMGATCQRVLLVDDIKINLDIIGSFLDAAGRSVVLATGGEEAVRLAAEQSFDLILMDVRMPGVDGLEATRRIRKLPDAHAQVPILALTAYYSIEQVAACLDSGMDGHVPKPVDYDTLIRAIDDAVVRVPSYRVQGVPFSISGSVPPIEVPAL